MPGGFEILRQRGFIQQCSDEENLKRMLNNESINFYAGFDPTGNSLHVGHLVPLFAMAHLQRAGHKPIALVGGGTARIGDPSGKTEMRKMLSIEAIKQNAESFKKQISRFIDFSDDAALMVDNAEWLADLNYITFLRDIGKHFSVNKMLSFESVKIRLESGLSFIEFNYQLLQSYDFLILQQKYGCLLQIGGDDQWGNIVSGIDLIRRIDGKQAYALTCPLIARSDGKKMGKTEKGALFLDPQLVSPYDFYQYWINITDSDVEKFLFLYTFLPVEEIKKLSALKDKEINIAKQILAYELTKIVHGEKAAEEAKKSSNALFLKDGADEEADAVSITITHAEFTSNSNIVSLFKLSGLCSSMGEARRLVAQGGAYINGKRYDDINAVIKEDEMENNALLLRAGKKRFIRIVVE
ncbi:MAG: tyrosine--tRNA ligase [Spirochaetales bacterium]|nr:tyrosine--tRNA ligase [Spirochaetales bacterium]